MWLQARMYFLIALMFAIVYAMVIVIARYAGVTNFYVYAVIASVMLIIQYLIGPKIIEWTMKIKYVSQSEAPELHSMVTEMAEKAGIPKPRVAISEMGLPNAFAFGRTKKDGRVCVTRGIMNLLTKKELKAVIGHEISHLKNRDVAVITLLSVIPMICWHLAWSFMFSGRRDRGNAALIGIAAFVLYFVTNLLVLYGSRIREYYADKGAVELGNEPHELASALYKLVYGSATASKAELKAAEGCRAFFANDPAHAGTDIKELKALDKDMSGTLDKYELAELKHRDIKLGTGDKVMELFTTHPNMLKRIKHLSHLQN
ncbi:MAG: M48 family metalloprotease [Nanoarchaeota archaeon]|nr:M48 family metalloprotease [Nanoarchaeota archaeon]